MIEINIDPRAALIAVEGLKNKSLTTPIRQAGEWMRRETQLNFARQSDPEGKPWEPLKPSTLRRKKTTAILRETGSLSASIHRHGPGSSGHETRIRVDVDYGIFHQTGTKAIPQREIIGISEKRHAPKIRKIFEDFFST